MVPSARADLRLTAVTATTPVLWGTTYFVTSELLPPDRPMTAAVLRALPAGLLLLAAAPRLPRGRWWGRLAVLSALNIGLFFPLLFLAAYRLPGGVAAVVGAAQPLIVAGLSLAVFGVRTRRWVLGWAAVAAVGVAMTVLTPAARLDPVGIAAALLGTTSMAAGLVLTARWGRPPGMGVLTATGWQLTMSGLALVPLVPLLDVGALSIDAAAVLGYAWLTLMGTALAYTVWFRGAAVLPSARVALLGPLAAVTAAAVGWLLLGQQLTALQVAGFAVAVAGVVGGQLRREPRPARLQRDVAVATP
jgi:probable blue pigment (indigoidine) exporter